jgi:DNA-binding transcriptional ArsR family regulator
MAPLTTASKSTAPAAIEPQDFEAPSWAGVITESLVPVGSDTLDLAAVLHALSDPIRLRIVAQLADGEEHNCGSFGLPIAKSTCSHHFRVLREAGIVQQRIDGKCRLNRLRTEQLEQRFPGLLAAVLRANEA